MSGTIHLVMNDESFMRKFAKEVAKRFILSPPTFVYDGIIYTGPNEELRRLQLFYEGALFYRKYGQ